MSTSYLKKNLYIITEGRTDAQILRSLLDCNRFDGVYNYVSNGFNNMPSVCRTVNLRMQAGDRILLVFDSDTRDPESIENKITTMTFLTRPDASVGKIGIFCMIPDMETALDVPHSNLKLSKNLAEYLEANAHELKSKPIMQDMQKFLNVS